MAERKPDRRVAKTERSIRSALADLLMEKELRSITVQELADKADIHRVTVYKHYMDVYDIYEQIEQDFLEQTKEMLLKSASADDAFYKELFKYILENEKALKMAFSPHNTEHLRDKLSAMSQDLCRRKWEKYWHGKPVGAKTEMVISYHVNGSLSILSDWILGGRSWPEQEVIEMLTKLERQTEELLMSLT